MWSGVPVIQIFTCSSAISNFGMASWEKANTLKNIEVNENQ